MNKNDLEEMIISLSRRVYWEAFDYLKIPKHEKKADHEEEYKLNQAVIRKTLNGETLDSETHTHMLRMACYYIRIMDYLNFQNLDYRQHGYIAALGHDIGKFGNHIWELMRKKDFNHKDMERMKEHVTISTNLVYSIDPIAAAIVERHHFYQPNSYPKKFRTDSTPEVEYMAKILAIIDFYDSASTRDNNRLEKSVADKIFRKKLPSKGTVKENILKTYGNLSMIYSGEILTKSDKNGHQFIEELYQVSIFGQEDTLNPFKGPHSFIYKSD